MGQRIVQQNRPRNAADFDYGKALGETILAALYVVALVVLLVLLLSAGTATGQLVWGIAFGVAALPLLYWIGRVAAALIWPARNARRHGSSPIFSYGASHQWLLPHQRPMDFDIDDLFVEFVKLLLIVLGLALGILGVMLLVKMLFAIPFWTAFSIVFFGGLFLAGAITILVHLLKK